MKNINPKLNRINLPIFPYQFKIDNNYFCFVYIFCFCNIQIILHLVAIIYTNVFYFITN